MCRMRVVFTRYACGHNVQEFSYDQQIDCEKSDCRLSACHMQDSHDCKGICAQWRRQPETFFPWVKSIGCPGCVEADR